MLKTEHEMLKNSASSRVKVTIEEELCQYRGHNFKVKLDSLKTQVKLIIKIIGLSKAVVVGLQRSCDFYCEPRDIMML